MFLHHNELNMFVSSNYLSKTKVDITTRFTFGKFFQTKTYRNMHQMAYFTVKVTHADKARS